MSRPYDVVVQFDDGQVMIFKDVDRFKHFPDANTWQIVTENEDCSYINDRYVRFIGPKYVWDKIQTKAEKDDECTPKPSERCCENCIHNESNCITYYDYVMGKRSKPDALTCPAFRKYD